MENWNPGEVLKEEQEKNQIHAVSIFITAFGIMMVTFWECLFCFFKCLKHLMESDSLGLYVTKH